MSLRKVMPCVMLLLAHAMLIHPVLSVQEPRHAMFFLIEATKAGCRLLPRLLLLLLLHPLRPLPPPPSLLPARPAICRHRAPSRDEQLTDFPQMHYNNNNNNRKEKRSRQVYVREKEMEEMRWEEGREGLVPVREFYDVQKGKSKNRNNGYRQRHSTSHTHHWFPSSIREQMERLHLLRMDWWEDPEGMMEWWMNDDGDDT